MESTRIILVLGWLILTLNLHAKINDGPIDTTLVIGSQPQICWRPLFVGCTSIACSHGSAMILE
ncbi:MAG: hypothetical protein IPJ51_20255 [Saprospiraceae bacterium]|nr:hypothetical protein [Saprospiraceae bacterium]